MNGLLAKRFQRRPDLVQHRPDAPSHQGHHAGIGRDGHLPYAPQLRAQAAHQPRGQHLRIGVQRDGHVALRGGNQVHRKPEVAEAGEYLLEKTDPAPHSQRLQRDQRHAAAQHDRLDLRAVGFLGRPHAGARQLGVQRRAHGHGDAAVAQRGDRQRMQHAAAGRRYLLRFGVAEPAQQPGAADFLRIGAEYAGHVGPDFEAFSADGGGQRRGGHV